MDFVEGKIIENPVNESDYPKELKDLISKRERNNFKDEKDEVRDRIFKAIAAINKDPKVVKLKYS